MSTNYLERNVSLSTMSFLYELKRCHVISIVNEFAAKVSSFREDKLSG